MNSRSKLKHSNLKALFPHIPSYMRATMGLPSSTCRGHFFIVCEFISNYTCVKCGMWNVFLFNLMPEDTWWYPCLKFFTSLVRPEWGFFCRHKTSSPWSHFDILELFMDCATLIFSMCGYKQRETLFSIILRTCTSVSLDSIKWPMVYFDFLLHIFSNCLARLPRVIRSFWIFSQYLLLCWNRVLEIFLIWFLL